MNRGAEEMVERKGFNYIFRLGERNESRISIKYSYFYSRI